MLRIEGIGGAANDYTFEASPYFPSAKEKKLDGMKLSIEDISNRSPQPRSDPQTRHTERSQRTGSK